MKILITGNLGYVGSHLTRILVDAGHEVVGCDLSLFPESICGKLATPARQIERDFRSLTAQDLKGVEAIAHLAGISNDPMGEINPGLTLSINGAGSVELANLAKKVGVKKFVFASSCSVYGSSGNRPRNENDPTNPLSEYATSKLFAEAGLAKIATDFFHVYLLRNATAYGASPVLRTDLVVNDLSAGICATGIAEVRTDGSPWRPLIHCLDMARAFKEFIESDPIQLNGKPVNIGFDSENYQVKDIGILLEEIWDSCQVTYLNQDTNDPRNYKVDFELLKKSLPGFFIGTNLRQGIFELREFLLQIKYAKKDRELKRYVRIEEIRKKLNQLS